MNSATANPSDDVTMARLEDQISWYDLKSMQSQRIFKRIKITEIFAAALIPFLVTFPAPYGSRTAAGLGILITILEGMLHLNQYQSNWIAYRSTCEALKHEKYVYLGKASPYAEVNDPHALLAERVESMVSQEHAKWASTNLTATLKQS
jgi:hypothetical protein